MKVESSFKHLEICFRKDRAPQVVVKLRVVEGRKTFGAMKMRSNVRSVRLGVKRYLYESVSTNVEVSNVSVG